jgi:hypothetical protein
MDFYASYEVFFKKQGGPYLLRDGKWTLNGIRPVFALLTPEYGIQIIAIDGESPRKLSSNNAQKSRQVLEPGWHDIESGYYRDETGTRIYGEEPVTFKRRYLFEEGAYRITGTPEGDKIVFRIERIDAGE